MSRSLDPGTPTHGFPIWQRWSACCAGCPIFYRVSRRQDADSINQYAQVIGAYRLSNHTPSCTALIGMFLQSRTFRHRRCAYRTCAVHARTDDIHGAPPAMSCGHCKSGYHDACAAHHHRLYALMPYNGAFAVTMWKDIPFAGCMTIFCAALMRFLLRGSCASSADAVPKLRISEYFTLLLPYVLSGTLLYLPAHKRLVRFCRVCAADSACLPQVA